MKEVHLNEQFQSFLFLTSSLFALPKLSVSRLGIAAVKVTVSSSVAEVQKRSGETLNAF